jgi:hypothetical protein
MADWLTDASSTLARLSGLPPESFGLDDDTRTRLLELARIAAHESGDRRNAPLLCYLVGLAAADVELETVVEAFRAD